MHRFIIAILLIPMIVLGQVGGYGITGGVSSESVISDTGQFVVVTADSANLEVITQNGFTIMSADSGDRILATYDTFSVFIGDQTDLPNCVEITHDGHLTVPGTVITDTITGGDYPVVIDDTLNVTKDITVVGAGNFIKDANWLAVRVGESMTKNISLQWSNSAEDGYLSCNREGAAGDLIIAADGMIFLTKDVVVEGALNVFSDSSTSDAYKLYHVNSVIDSTLTVGQEVKWMAAFENTGAVTITIENGAARPLVLPVSTALSGAEIKVGLYVVAIWDGTNWQMISQIAQ